MAKLSNKYLYTENNFPFGCVLIILGRELEVFYYTLSITFDIYEFCIVTSPEHFYSILQFNHKPKSKTGDLFQHYVSRENRFL